MKFVFENMPKTVLTVSKIVHAKKLLRVKKSQLVREKGRVLRTCINLVCNGFLGDDFKCPKCDSTFCKHCEEVLEVNHQCNQEDIESLKAINALVSCPSCGVKIEKGEGCMAITCAVCNQNFWYSTGEKGDHGNHGQFQKVRVNINRRLTIEYQKIIPHEFITLIREIEFETSETNDDSEEILATILIQNDGKEIKDFDLKTFSQKYSIIVRKRISQNIAIKKLHILEKILQKRDPGFEAELKSVLLPHSKIVMRAQLCGRNKKNNIVFLDDLKEYENLEAASTDTNILANEIKKAIELGDGIYGEYYWYFK